MSINNRIADVNNLKRQVCQEFLKLVIKPDWRDSVYEICQREVVNRNMKGDEYYSEYVKMRDKGLDYSIDDMDVPLIGGIVHYCGMLANELSVPTRVTLMTVEKDRSKSSWNLWSNDTIEDQYLNCLFSLCELKTFVNAVDAYEVWIDDECRIKFRRRFIPQIEDLKKAIDEERVCLICKRKNKRKLDKLDFSGQTKKQWIDSANSKEDSTGK